ncbi:MAG: lytic transglycosylase domain-containing protein [Epsilonproteobacteria bacterium]|nr:MAG: lytic transglycosylase domain-containing protein [Campylobacterota bacterium]
MKNALFLLIITLSVISCTPSSEDAPDSEEPITTKPTTTIKPTKVELLKATKYPSKYDAKIKKAAKRYLPGVDWRLLKAQYYQESRLNPLATSPVGAAGIAQFMPATWKQMQREMKITATSRDPDYAILAGAYYMAKLRKSWSSPRPWKDRLKLAQASYNAGLGNILKSQKKAGGASRFQPIIDQLHLVTGHNSKETRTYITRIWNYYPMMHL